MRHFQGFEGPIVFRHIQTMKIWINKKAINFSNLTTSIKISETRLPTTASLCQAGTHYTVGHLVVMSQPKEIDLLLTDSLR